MTTRDPYLDNARGLLIGLVVLGHVLTAVTTPGADVLNLWIYTFHMAAFVTVSGYVARNWTGTPRQAAAILTSLVVPYVLLDLLHGAIGTALAGGSFRPSVLTPAFTLWFLLALALWRLATPVIRVLRYPLVLATALSLLLPLERALDSTLTLGRVVGFLPFYVLGVCVTPALVDRLRSAGARWRTAGGIYLVALLAASWVLSERTHRGWFFMNGSYRADDLSPTAGLVVRSGVLVAGLLGTIAILLLTPRASSWLTRWGRNSLAIYVLHALIVRPLLDVTWLEDARGPFVVLGAITAAAALTAILALDPVSRGLNAVLRPAWLARLLTRPSPTEPSQRT
ncbi:acyltransferase family protein [Sanguibacter sp. A247]|uniref:acyltransferase family protein n=1 Tax=unclassified Sanguibacter TaxID=2645534 RepID=UPI003FD73370